MKRRVSLGKVIRDCFITTDSASNTLNVVDGLLSIGDGLFAIAEAMKYPHMEICKWCGGRYGRGEEFSNHMLKCPAIKGQ